MSEAQVGEALEMRRRVPRRVCCNGKERERNKEAERTTTSSNEGRDHYRMLKGLTSFTLSLFKGVDVKVKEALPFARVDRCVGARNVLSPVHASFAEK